MLDTRLCAFILRELAEAVLSCLEQPVMHNHSSVISPIT
jgi:hypothetical protein